jgi:hypothetical protein
MHPIVFIVPQQNCTLPYSAAPCCTHSATTTLYSSVLYCTLLTHSAPDRTHGATTTLLSATTTRGLCIDGEYVLVATRHRICTRKTFRTFLVDSLIKKTIFTRSGILSGHLWRSDLYIWLVQERHVIQSNRKSFVGSMNSEVIVAKPRRQVAQHDTPTRRTKE